MSNDLRGVDGIRISGLLDACESLRLEREKHSNPIHKATITAPKTEPTIIPIDIDCLGPGAPGASVVVGPVILTPPGVGEVIGVKLSLGLIVDTLRMIDVVNGVENLAVSEGLVLGFEEVAAAKFKLVLESSMSVNSTLVRMTAEIDCLVSTVTLPFVDVKIGFKGAVGGSATCVEL